MSEDRDPKSLDGLLKFCLREGADQNFTEMDPERAAFLREALKSGYKDEVEILKEHFHHANSLRSSEDPEDITKVVEDLEEIQELVENIDLAKCFFQMNGLEFVEHLLLSHSNIAYRILAARILSACAQNNDYCQKEITTRGILPSLVKLLATETDPLLIKGLVGVIGCSTRAYQPAMDQFFEHSLWSFSFKAMHKLQKAYNPDDNDRDYRQAFEKFSFMIFGITSSASNEIMKTLQTEESLQPLINALLTTPAMEEHLAFALREVACDLPRTENHDHDAPPCEEFRKNIIKNLPQDLLSSLQKWIDTKRSTDFEPTVINHLYKAFCL
ncbi:hypothetical protein Ciccas_007955 [Cichlidogyrus casuarinus]|uniref:Nucleotide exchange factor Fes1 domain-containing protein n=1 Tax=Cichlidogyrus casuarinus TaxID=1844966 RepID=A0ABD2Q241_9PLAT